MKAQHSYDYQIKKEWSQLQKIGKKKEEINNNFDKKLKFINDLRKKHYQKWLDELLEKILAYPPFDLDFEKATPEKVFKYIVELSQKSLDNTEKRSDTSEKNVESDKLQKKVEQQAEQKKDDVDDVNAEKGEEQKKRVEEKNDVQGKPNVQNEEKSESVEDIWSQTESF